MKIFRISNSYDKSFEQWFKNSKVVDEFGSPMPVFHGTNQKFKQFDRKSLGLNTFTQSAKEGFYFTENIEEAMAYANLSANKQIANRKEHEKKENEYLRNINEAERRGEWEEAERLTREMEDFSLNAIKVTTGQQIHHVFLSIQNPLFVNGKDITNVGEIYNAVIKAKKLGHDGVKFTGINDGFGKETNQWVAFNPSQIKIIKTEEI